MTSAAKAETYPAAMSAAATAASAEPAGKATASTRAMVAERNGLGFVSMCRHQARSCISPHFGNAAKKPKFRDKMAHS